MHDMRRRTYIIRPPMQTCIGSAIDAALRPELAQPCFSWAATRTRESHAWFPIDLRGIHSVSFSEIARCIGALMEEHASWRALRESHETGEIFRRPCNVCHPAPFLSLVAGGDR